MTPNFRTSFFFRSTVCSKAKHTFEGATTLQSCAMAHVLPLLCPPDRDSGGGKICVNDVRKLGVIHSLIYYILKHLVESDSVYGKKVERGKFGENSGNPDHSQINVIIQCSMHVNMYFLGKKKALPFQKCIVYYFPHIFQYISTLFANTNYLTITKICSKNLLTP